MQAGLRGGWARLGEAARSRRQSVPLLLAAMALAAGTWLAFHHDMPWGVLTGDGYEFADVARRLARGDGFTTGVVYPPHLREHGVGEHPSLLRPPLWPLALAAVFAVAGPSAAAAHGTLLAFLLATVGVAVALATRRAGRGAGAAAGLALATCSPFLLVSLGALSEIAFAFWVTLLFLLWERRAHPAWLGVACGLAYLTRYNGSLLLPVLLVALAGRPDRWRAMAACALAFGAVAAPWWMRNALVAGSPFYSLQNYNPFMSPHVEGSHASLYYYLEPDLSSPAAIRPLDKALRQLPLLLRHFPLLSANLAASAGVLLACWKRDASSLAFVAWAGMTTLTVAFVFPLGRYFAPMLPLLLVLGVTGWLRYGGRLRAPALVLLLAAPLLPSVPREAPDLVLARTLLARAQERERGEPEAAAQRAAAAAARARCLRDHPLVLAEQAPRLAWEGDVTAIYLPATAEDFWTVVREQPVDIVQIHRFGGIDRAAFDASFRPRPDCGDDFYARRQARGDG